MDWLIIIGLTLWVWRQSLRLKALSQRLRDLELRLAADAAGAASEPKSRSRSEPQAQGPAPLLLDTPVPRASNDQTEMEPDAPAATDGAASLLGTESLAGNGASPLLLTKIAPPLSVPSSSARKFEQWFAENALAWLGAGALALAGVYLASYAAQQNWFAPPARLACAGALGAMLIGAGEWARRGASTKLVGALLAGAGAASFYATIWAAHGLYHYVDAPIAALLLTICAAVLVGLACLHGEALGILAIVAALLAPPLSSIFLWSPIAVSLYVISVAIAGFALSAWRRWAWTCAATLAGLYFWFAAAIASNDVGRALAFVMVSSVGAAAMALREAPPETGRQALPWRQARQIWPTAAICIGSVLLLWAWSLVASSPSGLVAGPALIAAFQVALGAYAVRARVAAPATFAIAVAGLVLGFALYLSARAHIGPQGHDLYPTILLAGFAVIASAFAARPHRSARGLTAGAGAIGASLLILLAASTRPDWHALQAWAPLFAGAGLLFASAGRAARDVAAPAKDRAVDFWCGGAIALALIGVEAALPAPARAIGDAVATLALANAFARLNWPLLRYGALAGAALALAHALSPDLIETTLKGALPLWRALLYLGAAAMTLFAASRIARPASKASAEAFSSAALIVVLTSAFLALRWIAQGGAGAHLDDYTETALRALMLIAVARLALPGRGQTPSAVGRWRAHLAMGLGLIYALLALGLAENPWWGVAPAHIEGPLLLDGIALGFGTPALLAFAAARRLYGAEPSFGRFYAAAGGVFLVFWAVLEIRRVFHASAMAGPEVGDFEAACYALAALFMAWLVANLARWRGQSQDHPFARDLTRITDAVAWAALVLAAVVMLVLHHPWWGTQAAPTTSAQTAGFAVLAQAWAATLALGLGRALSRSNGVDASRFAAAAAAAMFGLSFCHASVRWLYHGAAMHAPAPFVGLEGFAQTLLPLAFILAASAITARMPGRQDLRAYLFDLEAIWSVAVWPALAFGALGLWFEVNPWWGPEATAVRPSVLGLAVAAYPLAALMSLLARRVAHIAFNAVLAPAVALLVAGHLLVGLTLIVRVIFHGLDVARAATSDVEMWSYSAVWAVFGAGIIAISAWRNDPALRWSGLAILAITAIKVFFVDAAQLSGIIRALSFLGFGVVATLAAIGSRRLRADHTLKISPSPRRERRTRRR